MLQVIRTTFTAPRLERRARRMMVPQSRTRARYYRSLEADMFLRLVTHQRRYGRGALTRLIPLLCRQSTQARVHPIQYRQNKTKQFNQSGLCVVNLDHTPVKTRQIANGVVDRHEAEWRDARLGVHGTRDISVREADFEAVSRREVVCWFWCRRERVTAACCEEEETNACLWRAVVRCLEQAEAHLVATWCSMSVSARRGENPGRTS